MRIPKGWEQCAATRMLRSFPMALSRCTDGRRTRRRRTWIHDESLAAAPICGRTQPVQEQKRAALRPPLAEIVGTRAWWDDDARIAMTSSDRTRLGPVARDDTYEAHVRTRTRRLAGDVPGHKRAIAGFRRPVIAQELRTRR